MESRRTWSPDGRHGRLVVRLGDLEAHGTVFRSSRHSGCMWTGPVLPGQERNAGGIACCVDVGKARAFEACSALLRAAVAA